MNRRHAIEAVRLLRRRDDLLVRAREAGWTNTQIAQALSRGDTNFDPRFPWYTPQAVTALMRRADERVARSADRFA